MTPKRPIHSIGCVTPPLRGHQVSGTNGWFHVVCWVLKAYQTLLNMTMIDYYIIKPSVFGASRLCQKILEIESRFANLLALRSSSRKRSVPNIGLHSIKQWCFKLVDSYSIPSAIKGSFIYIYINIRNIYILIHIYISLYIIIYDYIYIYSYVSLPRKLPCSNLGVENTLWIITPSSGIRTEG